ncbi:MAG TPA: tRNA uridine-5-carboxymethylaminomethyl(34) synthesis GTPase MnmE [Steroidobacteraceae bacterium]|nr:tRNA uridine-5-carboxymethylaminomethyl(34) synthesis GTPase MnmE [Steroidobacteraceae bacterium]
MSGAPTSDTVVAAATPGGRGGVAVVRVSGPRVREISQSLLGIVPEPRVATYRKFLDAGGEPIDQGIALYFCAPRSMTGEDVLELHGHGGPVVVDLIVRRILECGARIARPGEFTERAFLNDKMDLAQAEAVADLIDSATGAAARAAMRSLQGEFSDEVQTLTEALIDLRMFVEAAIDFPEEEIDFLSASELTERLARVFELLAALESAARQGQILRDGMVIVIAGRPNAGKSSLMNRLAGYDAAIVTPQPGTTRDVLRERVEIDGMPVSIIDTAGLREAAEPVEAEGVRRARAEMSKADRILFIVDVTAAGEDDVTSLEWQRLPPGVPVTRVHNKIDLVARGRARVAETAEGSSELWLSALTGEGLDLLRTHLKACMGFETAGSGTVSARRRHLEALARARGHLEEARSQLVERRAGELMAEELRGAQGALAEITGEFTSDDLLGRIFGGFCVGK